MSYNKTTWVTGDIITAEKLNNIENEVAKIDGISTDLDDLSSELTNEINSLSEDLSGDIDTLSEKVTQVERAVGAPMVASLVSQMTDQTRVYVYTGSETGYTAGNWYYYDGTAWVSGGVYNAVAVNTDTTLTLAGVPADAKATGDKIGELKSEISDVQNINVDTLWQRQTIGNGSTNTIGTTTKKFESSTTRLATNPIISTNKFESVTVSPAEGYKFNLFFFNEAVSTVKTDTGWVETEQTYIPGNGYMAIVLAKTDNTTIGLDEYANLEITVNVIDGRIDAIEKSIDDAEKEIEDQKSELENIESVINGDISYSTDPELWGRYVIATNPSQEQIGTTGKAFEHSSTRISLYPVVSANMGKSITISPDSGFKFYLFAFNEALSTIVIDSGWQTAEKTYDITSDIGYFSVVVAKTDNSTIVRSECVNCAVSVNAFGGRIANLEKRIGDLENPLPEYWTNYLQAKSQILEYADMNLGFDGVSFAFVTDTHIDTNAKMSPKLLEYITEHTNVRKVICGGDIITNYSTKDHALSELRWWAQNTSGLDIVNLHGNHDGNSNNQTDNTQIISDAEFYGLCCRQSEGYVKWEHNTLYGYRDNENQKTRFIYLDTGAPDSAVIGNAQIEWMKNRITELPSGWFVVVFCHQFWTGVSKTTETLNIDSNGTAIKNALESIYDNVNAVIACVITGHCHRNYSMYSDKGFPIIATTCDTSGTGASTYDPDTPNRTAGTTTEQCFDLFYVNTSARTIKTIRIGAGDTDQDRSFTF